MRLGLIGCPLGHSYSKIIHELFGGEYFLKELPEDKVGDFLTRGDWDGLNVTIPYKRAVLPYCAELGDAAKKVGCVNTLVRRADGSIFGDNTDYYGFLGLARRAGCDFRDRKVLVLGSGGASLTARCVARDEGAREVYAVSRHPSADDEISYDDALARHADAEIVVNATPVGMYPKETASPLDLSVFPNVKFVLDAIYNPLRPELVLNARKLGATAVGGLYMLVAQAAKAREIFGAPNERSIDEVYRRLLRDMQNVALVGMPGCGKSTIAVELSKALGRKVIDLDERIVETAGMSIPDIFEREGEPGFRDRESAELERACLERGVIIATGGGTVLREQNRKALRRNCRVYLIERDLERLETDGRPLSTSAERLREMAVERRPFYLDAADKTVLNVILSRAVNEIVRDLNENSCD